jgi:chlorite dismutase
MTNHTSLDIQNRPADAELEIMELSEKGRNADGEVISLDRRLFMQFMAFGNCHNTAIIIRALDESRISGVLYEDINDPFGIGLLTFSESVDDFIGVIRRMLTSTPFIELTPKPEYTMLGRTYSIGYEQDLEETLIYRPKRRVCDPRLPWAVWYPLRRSGSFEQLSSKEQNVALMEHGGIGRAFGRAGLAYDIRLACHGMDKNDNDFVVGLLGPDLYPLSMVVQRMRKTKQTSQHLERLGPFFIGKVAWQQHNT